MKYISLGIILLLPILASCKKVEMESQFRENEILIDGKNDDWAGQYTFLEKEKISIGILNDKTHLYLSIGTNDRLLIRKIMGQGFVLWFDAQAGKNKKYGIRFPLGRQNPGMDFAGERGARMPDDRQLEAIKTGNELEIIGKDEEILRKVILGSTTDFEVKLNLDYGMLQYELKIPLQKEDEFAIGIGTEAGKKIGVGFMTQEMDREKMRSGMPGGMGGRGGGMKGGGGRMGGGRPGGGMPGGLSQEMMQPLKIWATVQLAAQD
ncbi:MAG: hypothetical protein DWQ05_02095 [Calditrichaeota bacterium]|nr:MAG: hypothetical protein DWQ05_02095 [Calditrichota bacterium]